MTQKNSRFYVKVILVIVAIVVIRFYQQTGLIEGLAPTFLTQSITGQEMTINPPHERAIVVRFWATWCGICSLENSNFQSLIEDGVPVLNIAWQSGSDELLLEYATKNKLDANTIINDRFGVLANKYGVKATPITFIINSRGEIAFKEVGYTTQLGLKLRLWWANQQH